jgi:hypothetical protein
MKDLISKWAKVKIGVDALDIDADAPSARHRDDGQRIRMAQAELNLALVSDELGLAELSNVESQVLRLCSGNAAQDAS